MQYSQSTPTSTRETPIQHASSRSLWVGNIDETITIDSLNQIFSTFGPIESIRLLPEKECGFVNFFQLEDAIRAKEEVLGNLGGRIGRCIVRVGFGKVDTAVTEASNSQPTRALCKNQILLQEKKKVLSICMYRARKYPRKYDTFNSAGRFLGIWTY